MDRTPPQSEEQWRSSNKCSRQKFLNRRVQGGGVPIKYLMRKRVHEV